MYYVYSVLFRPSGAGRFHLQPLFPADRSLHLSRAGAAGGLYCPPVDDRGVCPGWSLASGDDLPAALEGS